MPKISALAIRIFLISALTLLFLHPVSNARCETAEAQKAANVAVLPLTINAAKDLSYLKNGIGNMISSRLSANTGAKIIDKTLVNKALTAAGLSEPGTTTPEILRKIGNGLGADYLIQTSLTALGGGMSLDARVITVAGKDAPQNFYATAAKEDDVLLAVNQMVWDISEKVFGKQNPANLKKTLSAPQPTINSQDISSYQTPHPDRAFMYPSSQNGEGLLIRPMGMNGGMGFTKSQNLTMDLQGMDVGDIDGDGAMEIVLADKSKITIYKRTASSLQLFANIPIKSKNYIIHAVNVADLNNNGRAEIYVSAADRKGPDSFALEWDGQKTEYIFEHVPWYIRTLTMPEGRTILAGQKADTHAPIKPGIFELKPATKLQIIQKLQVPAKINLFDFALADINEDGRPEIIAIDQFDRLRVLRPDGRIIWQSDDRYGGTTRYLGEDMRGQENNLTEEEQNQERIYIPSRIIIKDLNNDGRPDILVNKNNASTSRAFKNLKSYPSGEIHALTWNGISLAEIWHTRKIGGYVAEYQLLPEQDQPAEKTELFVGLILRSSWLSGLPGAGESTILTYQLDLTPQDAKE